jgi:hypothetical protein
VDCTACRLAMNAAAKTRFRAKAHARLPLEVRQQLLEAVYAGQPFRTVLRDLGVTSNQVWGLAKTDQEWAAELEAALTATRRTDLKHGSNAAYKHGCVCRECREHQRQRMANGFLAADPASTRRNTERSSAARVVDNSTP